MEENNEYQYWRDQDYLVRTKGDQAWVLQHDPVHWEEWDNWRDFYARIGDWKWSLENKPITIEQATRLLEKSYGLKKAPE